METAYSLDGDTKKLLPIPWELLCALTKSDKGRKRERNRKTLKIERERETEKQKEKEKQGETERNRERERNKELEKDPYVLRCMCMKESCEFLSMSMP